MQITYYSSTNEVLCEMGRRIKAARIAASATQQDLAEMTNLSLHTIKNIECGRNASLSSVIDVMRSLGILENMDALVPERSVRPGQFVSLGKERERVSRKSRREAGSSNGWKWGDER